MPGISRVGVDAAVGTIVGNLAPTVFVNNDPIVVIGAAVVPHTPFTLPHNTSVMAAGSSTVFANNIAICRAGDAASCGDAATGSSNVFGADVKTSATVSAQSPSVADLAADPTQQVVVVVDISSPATDNENAATSSIVVKMP